MDKKGFPATWTATVTLGVVWSLLVLYDSQWTLLPSFVCYALFRTFLFTFLFAFIADTMGFRYFGVLAGIMFVIGGLVGLLQYPLAKWAAGNCHLATTPLARIHCDRGNWSLVNLGNGDGDDGVIRYDIPLTPSHPSHTLLTPLQPSHFLNTPNTTNKP